ncbi:uncharacterized protein LOC124899469 [Capsicum annuum]|uniref:uncharacterized protein LOC124899469 n=1 Tax=Capsicum annuum TaxID=4072 RepID=UPI001FB0C490|nr:uncharacterized protein LOC124899469 [Capsicum annuum]
MDGQPKGFFKSSRGLKQGDPLLPALFIIAAEVLSRSQKELMRKKEFKLFAMPRGSPKINHLAFVEDMVIMCKVDLHTLQLVTSTLDRYERVSSQKINKEKSVLYLHGRVSNGVVVMAEVATGILRREFSFNYLGCPIFYMRKKKVYYQQLMNRISNKIQA